MMEIVYTGEMDPRMCKTVLGETIPAIAADDPDVIYLDADLMSCIGTGKWAKENPGRAVNCGIAEANMAGVACGLASAGFKPILHTFGPFASRRWVLLHNSGPTRQAEKLDAAFCLKKKKQAPTTQLGIRHLLVRRRVL